MESNIGLSSEAYAAYKFGKGVIRSNMDENEERESDEDSYQGAAMNLLDISNPSRWANNKSGLGSNGEGSQAKQLSSEVSITKIYQPKFIKVYEKYCETLKQPIDTNRHLMSMCLDHLVSFSCWARETRSRCQWIRTVLEENVDLRPEVRNGLSMILIYCLSAARALNAASDEDMFTILQETDTGLGIVNKTSLKIYNDPFNYFHFLKSCISGLIDAGKIPENERQNQPKKAKRQNENKEEIYAFLQVKNILVHLLDKGDKTLARATVTEVSNIWHQKQKSIRSQRFAAALSVLAASSSGSVASTPHAHVQPGGNAVESLSSLNPIVQTHLPALLSNLAGSEGCIPLAIDPVPTLFLHNHLSSTSNSSCNGERDLEITTNLGEPEAKVSRSALKGRASALASIPALRFERIGHKEWEIKENKVFNIESLVLNHTGTFCLVDEAALPENKVLLSASTGMVSFVAALQETNALLTSYPKVDHSHLLDLLEKWMSSSREGESPQSLLHFWQNSSLPTGKAFQVDTTSGRAVLGYEISLQIGLVLRKNPAFGLEEDCWRLIYPRDLQQGHSEISFFDFLKGFFPQSKSFEDFLKSAKPVVVKYLGHFHLAPLTQPPQIEQLDRYQTIGIAEDSCSQLLARFDTGLSFHDIQLHSR